MAKRYDSSRYMLIDRETGETVDVQSNLVELERGDSYKTADQHNYYMAHVKNFKK